MLEAIGVRNLAARVYAELARADQPSVGDVAMRRLHQDRRRRTSQARLARPGVPAGRAAAPDLALNALIGQREEEFRQARARRTRWSGGASRTACPTGPWHGTPAIMKRTDVSITRLLLIRVSQADV
jgi:hypothetical protein